MDEELNYDKCLNEPSMLEVQVGLAFLCRWYTVAKVRGFANTP